MFSGFGGFALYGRGAGLSTLESPSVADADHSTLSRSLLSPPSDINKTSQLQFLYVTSVTRHRCRISFSGGPWML